MISTPTRRLVFEAESNLATGGLYGPLAQQMDDGYHGPDNAGPSPLRQRVLALANDDTLSDADMIVALRKVLDSKAAGTAAESLAPAFRGIPAPRTPTTAAGRRFAELGSLASAMRNGLQPSR